VLHADLSNQILGMAFTVHNILGPGLLEHCYQEALCVELQIAGLSFERQKVYNLTYKGRDIGGYIADIVVDNKIILELKSVPAFHPAMEAQIINYVRLAKCQVGYLINFRGLKVEWKRYVFEEP
jgi:GxxExxY protein